MKISKLKAAKVLCLVLFFAAPLCAETVKLTWDPNDPAENVIRYHVYRSEGLVSTTAVPVDFRGIMAPVTNSATDVLPDDGLTYTYQIKAFNGTVESGFSNQVVVTTTKAPSAPKGAKRVP